MNLFEPTPAGSAAAAALVVAGAPIFSSGLRVLRLRRRLSELKEWPLSEVPSGFVLVRGRVALESPLVGPLSGRPCAGFTLEIRGSGATTRVDDRRPFRLGADGAVAQVLAQDGVWQCAATAERAFAHHEAISQNLTALFHRSPEAGWIARAGAFTVTERALLAGQECWVIGHGAHGRPYELPDEVESRLARTGTDDVAHVISSRADAALPDLWIQADGHLQFLRVSDHALDPRDFAPPPWGLVLTALGPLLTLTGLVYLTRAAERWRALLGG